MLPLFTCPKVSSLARMFSRFFCALVDRLGLPSRLGVHVDLTGELLTARVVWRRERVAGLHVLARAAPAPLKISDRLALLGRYYAVTG